MKKKLLQHFFLFSLILILYVQTNAQKVFYSEKETNAQISNYYIIGQVKNHILIWLNARDNPENSEFYIYDNNLHILNKVKTNVITSSTFYSVDFINNIDSFQLIYQYISKHNYFCKRAVFDDNGNNLRTEQLDSIHADVASDYYKYIFSNLSYEVIQSNNKQSFALVKVPQDQQKKIATIDYRLFDHNNEISNKQILPFDLASNEFSGLLLDDNDNLVLSITNSIASNYQLGIYKINLVNNILTNSLRTLEDGSLFDKTINISASAHRYIITAAWKTEKGRKSNGIFLWQLNKDLSDAETDTVLEKNFDSNSVTFNLKSFLINAFQDYNDKLNLVIFSKNFWPPQGNFFLTNKTSSYNNNFSYYNRAIGSGTVYSSNPYNGNVRIANMYDGDGLDDFISNAAALDNQHYYYTKQDSSTNNSSTFAKDTAANNYNRSAQAQLNGMKLISLRLDNKNNILGSQTFTDKLDPELISDVSEAKVFQSNSGLNILFQQTITSKKNGLGYIKLYPDNEYNYHQIILMQLNYQSILRQSVQINPDAVIVPGVISNRLVFAKIQFK